MGMHTIRWRSGATDSGQIPCLPMLGLRQCALSPFPACCYRQSLLAITDLQHGACRCAGMRYASSIDGDILFAYREENATMCRSRVLSGRSVHARIGRKA